MRSYLSQIKRYGWVVLACAVLAAAIGIAVARAQPTVYQASSVLLVQEGAPGTTFPGGPATGATATDSLGEALNYAAEIPTRSIMTYIVKTIPELQQHHYTVDDLLLDVTASTSTTAATITLTAVATHPADAVLLANDVANGFASYIQARAQQQLDALRKGLSAQIATVQQQKSTWESKILALPNTTVPQYTVYNNNLSDTTRTLDTLQSQFQALPSTVNGDASVLQTAALRDATATPRGTIITAVTAGVGLLVGLLVMLLLVFLDGRPRNEEELRERLGLAYLGGFSTRSAIGEVREHPKGAALRELSDICANLRLTGVLPGSWLPPAGAVLLITSAREAEGKTTLATSLAAAAALGGLQVAVVDGNLRQPATHLAFKMGSVGTGLSGLLKGMTNVEGALLRTNVAGVWLLPAGSPLDNAALIMEQRLPEILRQLRGKVGLVIIDGPCLLSGADASFFATLADGVALVSDERHEKRHYLLRAGELLGSLTSRPAGVIMNRLGRGGRNRYYAAPAPRNATAGSPDALQSYSHADNGMVQPLPAGASPLAQYGASPGTFLMPSSAGPALGAPTPQGPGAPRGLLSGRPGTPPREDRSPTGAF